MTEKTCDKAAFIIQSDKTDMDKIVEIWELLTQQSIKSYYIGSKETLGLIEHFMAVQAKYPEDEKSILSDFFRAKF